MRTGIVLILCVHLALSLAFSPDKHQLLGWEKGDFVEPGQSIKFSIYLKQQNLNVLESLFWEVSNPNSPQYGRYLTQSQITDIVAPQKQSIVKVMKWLSLYNVEKIELVENQDVMVVFARVGDVENMFNVKMSTFTHKSGKSITRSSSMYTLPENLNQEIQFVLGVSNFPKVSSKSRTFSKPIDSELVRAGEPIIQYILGVDKTLQVMFTPTCMQGNTSTLPPCSDHPPALVSVLVTAVSSYDSFFSSKYVGDIDCEDVGGEITCTIPITVSNYNLYNVSIQSFFQNHTESSVVSYPYPAMASPALTPQSIKSYYNIPVDQKVTSSNVTQAVGEFEQQYYDEADLQFFFEEMGLPFDTPVTVIGPNNQSNPGVEANLDIQYIMGIGVGAPTTFWSIFANSTLEIDDILSWAVAMSNATNPPIVNSLSYGMTEMAVDLFLGKGYLNRSDVEFQKLALRGITIIIADGDAGGGDLGPPPMSADTCMPLHADWPSQSQYVTAVSATMFTPLAEPICYLDASAGGQNCANNPLGEVPTSVLLGTPWTTGGGFSNTSMQPSYQTDFVKQYLATLNDYNMLPPPGYFNPLGRAYPDVAMVGHNLLIAQNLTFMTVDGTSASAPVFAGFVSLLNSVRVQAGKPLLGFLNPVLYQVARDHPEAYNDIVVGNNRCGDVGFTPTCCPYGYEAVPGFDAVTGLGSPDFAVFKEVILNY